jgi:release factor glutamine methyltransferase|tara:strand:- start:30616 stop:31791 length:1176 start_codon:yes stop_codon:yes gene_type:complete
MSTYEPREDSMLLKSYVRQHAKGSVLDIGTGSGIQAITAAKSRKVKKIIATDIQRSIINYNKKNIKNKKITFIISDLFQIFKRNKNLMNKKFDTIIFNPPYLPQELKLKDLTLEGGKKGYEVIEKFLNKVNDFLKTNGIILIIFSSLTKKEKIDEFIKNNLLDFKELTKKHIFFEDLYVYKINKSAILKNLEQKGIRNLRYFAKGKRGFIFTGNYKNKKVAVKIKNPESRAIFRINNETNFLKILNKKNIGPKLLFSDKDYLIYEFVDGYFINDYLKINEKENIKRMLKNIFEQLFVMDKLKINKEEMSHPVKHIIINKKKPVLIDFERAHHTIKPGNVTQFCDFLISNNIKTALKNNKIKIDNKKVITLAKKYKKNINKNNLNKIINEFK